MRRTIAVIRIVAGIALLATVGYEISDDLAHHAFDPSDYFAYFTIETALADVVVLLVGGWWAMRHARDSVLLSTAAMCIAVYAVITTVVYNALLRGLADSGYQGPDWINEVLHVAIPILLILDWIVAPGRAPLRWRQTWWVLLYPLAWIVFTMVRGAIDAWYPYPFLVPGGAGGVAGVVEYIAGLAVAMVALGLLAVQRTRIGAAHTKTPESKPGGLQ